MPRDRTVISRIPVVLGLVVLLATPASAEPPYDQADVVEPSLLGFDPALIDVLLPTTVFVLTRDADGTVNQGSGVVASEGGLVVVAAEMVALASLIEVQARIGDRVVSTEARLERIDLERGLALLRVDAHALTPRPVSDYLGRGAQRVVSLSYPAYTELQRIPRVGRGWVWRDPAEEKRPGELDLVSDLVFLPGMAGAPVFLETGELIGVLRRRADGAAAVAPWSRVLDLLDPEPIAHSGEIPRQARDDCPKTHSP